MSSKPVKSTAAKERYNAAVLAEEATTQEHLRVKKEKNQARKEIEIAKIQALAKVKIEKAKGKREEKLARIQLARVKLEQEHQLRLAQINSSRAGPSSSSLFAGNDDYSFDSGFPVLPSSDAGNSSASSPYGFGTMGSSFLS